MNSILQMEANLIGKLKFCSKLYSILSKIDLILLFWV